jgi:fibronectin type 3 domain-containing protein
MVVVLTLMVLLVNGYTPVAHADAVSTVDTALDSQWNTYGNQGGHWTGGDETVSVALPDGRIAWLFSDTFLGTVNSDYSRPANTPLIHNCIVVQQGSTLTTLTGGTASAPTSLVGAATDGNANDAGYWVDDAFVFNNQLEVFYTHYQHTGSGTLDIKQVATAIAVFSLPALSLQSLTQLNVGASLKWGTAVLDQSDYTYVYGAEDAGANKYLHLARAPHGQVLSAGSNPTSAWQFWTGSGWSSSESNSTRIMSGVGDGFSVAKINQQYVLVTQDTNLIFNPNLAAYTATTPMGPFGNQAYLYKTPEATGNDITYDARLHTELGSATKLVISYNVNSLQASDNYADVRIYRPRFIDVTWPVAAPNPTSLPTPPTNLKATSDSQGIHLSWTASTTSGVGYWVYQQDVTAGQTQPSRRPDPVTSGTTLSLADLINGDTYQFKVTAYNSAGESPPSNSVTAVFTISAPTAAPTGLKATANSDGTISLQWNAVTGLDISYNVYERDDTAGDTSFTFSNSVPTGPSTTVSYLIQDHKYEFEVSAVNPGGEGPRSAPVTATSHAVPPPAPTGLTARANNDGTITLNWTAPGPGLWYWVYWRDVTAGQSGYTKSIYPLTSGTTFTVTNRQVGDVYAFHVTAINAGGESSPSNTVQATSYMPPPSAPTKLIAEAGNGKVSLSWTAPSPGLWYWVYWRDVSAGQTSYTKSQYPVTSGTTFTVTYLTDGDTYEFYVTAINAGGESAPSNTALATPLPPLPSAPTGLSAKANNDGTITLNWTAPGPNLWYWVYWRDTSTGQTHYTRSRYPLTSGTTFTVTYLTVGDTYAFYVTAINLAGEGPASNVVQATSYMPPPPAPTNLTATAGNGQVTLSWTAPGPNLWYWVWWRDVSPNSYTNSYTRSIYPVTSGTTFTVTYLINTHTYDFFVTAINAGGGSPPSNVVSVTLPIPDGGASAAVRSNFIYPCVKPSASCPPDQYHNMGIQVTGQRRGTTMTVNFSWTDNVQPIQGPTIEGAAFGFGLIDCTTFSYAWRGSIGLWWLLRTSVLKMSDFALSSLSYTREAAAAGAAASRKGHYAARKLWRRP